MRFRYPLQKIVDLKTNQKTQAEWMLSKAVGKLKEEEDSLLELHQEKLRLEEELVKLSEQSVTISSMLINQQYINHINNQIQQQNKQILAAQNIVEHKKIELQTKMQDEKVWNMTRDKALSLFQAEFLKKEQDALDEMATVRYINSAP
jgi:flagellar FliJ protein